MLCTMTTLNGQTKQDGMQSVASQQHMHRARETSGPYACGALLDCSKATAPVDVVNLHKKEGLTTFPC